MIVRIIWKCQFDEQITADASKITPIKVGGDAVDLELPSTVSTASRMVVERPHRKSIATLSSGNF